MKTPRESDSMGRFLQWGFRQRLPLERETALFILVNLLDFAMTYYMLMDRGEEHDGFYESNPFAVYFLNHWGVRGLLLFKMAVVAFVCVIAQIVATRKLSTARNLLAVGTVLVSAVVVYSFRLFLRHSAEHDAVHFFQTDLSLLLVSLR